MSKDDSLFKRLKDTISLWLEESCWHSYNYDNDYIAHFSIMTRQCYKCRRQWFYSPHKNYPKWIEFNDEMYHCGMFHYVRRFRYEED